MSKQIESLTSSDTGSYVVTTTSGSRYVLDLDEQLIRRDRRDESDWLGDIRRGISSSIVSIASCVKGSRLAVALSETNEAPNDSVSYLLSTPIDKIERIYA